VKRPTVGGLGGVLVEQRPKAETARAGHTERETQPQRRATGRGAESNGLPKDSAEVTHTSAETANWNVSFVGRGMGREAGVLF